MGYWQNCYQRILNLSGHPHAAGYLAGLSVIESSVFPIPPDTLLIPMVLAKPEQAWYYAILTTLSSVLGGLIGYALGYFAFEWLGEAIVQFFHAEKQFELLLHWFNAWGLLIIFLGGVTPIPYKLFTIAAGALQMSLPIFIVGSLIGRGARFCGVALLFKCTHRKVNHFMGKYIDKLVYLGLSILTLLVLVGSFWNFSQ